MGASVFLAVWFAASGPGVAIPKADVQEQNEIFQKLWGTAFVWKFDDLPVKGGVSRERIPYSGYLYLDKNGGTTVSMRKYDRAFYPGRTPATSWEQQDCSAYDRPIPQPGGLFGLRQVTRMGTPNWHGHCNGWAAAAIRHAEPEQSVTRNGVVFTPADIKGLLAELYIYNDVQDLSGSGESIQAGVLHAVIANWMGRGSHPLGMEAMPGPEKWNYPAYAFNSSSVKRNARQVEVKLNLAYAGDSQMEYQESPRIAKLKYFHYLLDLNAAGEIIGGQYFGDSARIDMLWMPMLPKAAERPGNERGNPYLSVDQILSIWRDSVSEEKRKLWLVVDPAPADRITDAVATGSLIPLPHSTLAMAAATPEPASSSESAASTESQPETRSQADAAWFRWRHNNEAVGATSE